MSWIDDMPASERADLADAGRIGASRYEGADHGHAYPDDPIRRNLDAVRTGAMVHDPGSDAELRRRKLIRINRKGWYDLTPLGRATLDGTLAERQEVSIVADGLDG